VSPRWWSRDTTTAMAFVRARSGRMAACMATTQSTFHITSQFYLLHRSVCVLVIDSRFSASSLCTWNCWDGFSSWFSFSPVGSCIVQIGCFEGNSERILVVVMHWVVTD
jgi:hypothetical protein